jgi:hypothetical protein
VKLPNSAHEQHPFVIARIAPDFRLLDVWALPVEGDRDEFGRFIETVASLDPAKTGSALSRALFWVRFRLGELFGWDDTAKERAIPENDETTLSARLPEFLRGSVDAPVGRPAGRFTPLYRTEQEWAAELSNETVHGVLHLAWVPGRAGRYRAQMGIYVKPRGKLGRIYLKLIQPFRHLIVYPVLTRQIGRAWEAQSRAGAVES